MTIIMDEVPIPLDAEISSSDFGTCEDCGREVPPTKSGRQFAKCIDCRRTARAERDNGTSPTRRTTNWEGPLSAQLTDMFDGIGMAVSFFEPYDGSVVRQGAPRLGTALIGPARTNRKVRTALENVVAGGAWAGVIMAVAAIAIPIMSHHGLIPGMPSTPVKVPSATAPGNVGHVNV